MARIYRGLIYAATAYLAATVVGYLLVSMLSSNVHDRELEATMTSIFIFGPAAATVAFVVGLLRRREH